MKLSAPEIISLMEAARKYGITELKLGALRFTTFGYVPTAAEAHEKLLREDQAAQDWATAEPPPPHSESM